MQLYAECVYGSVGGVRWGCRAWTRAASLASSTAAAPALAGHHLTNRCPTGSNRECWAMIGPAQHHSRQFSRHISSADRYFPSSYFAAPSSLLPLQLQITISVIHHPAMGAACFATSKTMICTIPRRFS